MTRDGAYLRDVIRQVEQVRERCPQDLADLFGSASGLRASDFSACASVWPGAVAAVDGSNATLLESRSFSIAAVRAAVSCFQDKARLRLGRTSLRLVGIPAQGECRDFVDMYRECFSEAPDTPLRGDDRSGPAGVIRDTLEYAAALETIEQLGGGDVLLLDGSLRVSHASHLPVLREMLRTAGSRGVLVGAVTKHTQLTWEDGHPLVQAVSGWADRLGVAAPWYVAIPSSLLDGIPHQQWGRGLIYVAKLHPRALTAFKVEIPDYAAPEDVERIFTACAAYADDGRIPGYPYPLMDAHRTVCIGEDTVDQIRQDLIRGFAAVGMNRNEFHQIFGDYHEEFARY
jgi:hypothetical protein